MNTYQHSLPPCAETGLRPGPAASLSGLAMRLYQAWRTRVADRQKRRAFLNLAVLDDRILDDIGLKRSDVEAAASLPLTINASQAVRQIAADRRAEERRVRRR